MRKALSKPRSKLQMHWVTAFEQTALWQRHNKKPAVHVRACLCCHEAQTTERISCHTHTHTQYSGKTDYFINWCRKKQNKTAYRKSRRMETLWLSFGCHSWSVESLNKEQANGADGHLWGDSLGWINISLHTDVLRGNILMYFWWDQITGCHGCPLCFCRCADLIHVVSRGFHFQFKMCVCERKAKTNNVLVGLKTGVNCHPPLSFTSMKKVNYMVEKLNYIF